MTPDVSSVLDAYEANRGAATIRHALQQAAEQACYRYLRDFLDKLMDYPAMTIREQYEGLIRDECLRLDKLIAGSA